jgi:hypothetical protein
VLIPVNDGFIRFVAHFQGMAGMALLAAGFLAAFFTLALGLVN